MNDEYIPINKCIEGHAYKIMARGCGRVGIFQTKPHKYAFELLDDTAQINIEFHYNAHEKYGTVKPLEDLGETPEFKTYDEKLTYLKKMQFKTPDSYFNMFLKKIKERKK